MNITKADSRVIILWTIIAFIAAAIGGKVLLNTGTVETTSSSALWLLWVFVYGFCGFRAVRALKGKTELSWRAVTVCMIISLFFISMIIQLLVLIMIHASLFFFSVVELPGFIRESLDIVLTYSGAFGVGIIFIYAATILGGYVSHKVFLHKQKP